MAVPDGFIPFSNPVVGVLSMPVPVTVATLEVAVADTVVDVTLFSTVHVYDVEVGEFVVRATPYYCFNDSDDSMEFEPLYDMFDKDNLYGFTFFPGLKHKLGWVGCGMSYKFILKKAAEQGLERILVCEDDVYNLFMRIS